MKKGASKRNSYALIAGIIFVVVALVITITSVQAERNNNTNNDNNGKSVLKTFDSNGKELGVFVTYFTFYDDSINKFVNIDNNSGKVINSGSSSGVIYYAQANCTGTAYLASEQGTKSITLSSLYPDGNGKFFVIDQSVVPSSKSLVSSYKGGTTCDNNASLTATVSTLKEVSVSFSNPISLPLQYKIK